MIKPKTDFGIRTFESYTENDKFLSQWKIIREGRNKDRNSSMHYKQKKRGLQEEFVNIIIAKSQ
jgi:hypothetical protein